ncbi:MAG: DUF169 domain-containing protein [Methanosarcinaceae archaeon]|nr:DUF169 domain-containing protein [Methanosarcinaceae archaeon]
MSLEEIKKCGAEIRELLEMDTYPVAVKLIKAGEEIPEGFEKPEKQMRHCEFVGEVRRTGKSYVAKLEDQLCKGGAAALGLGQLSEKVKSGVFYYENLGHFKTLEAAKKTVDGISFLPANSNSAILYAPLEKTFFEPDVVLFVCNPKQAMVLTQSELYTEGGRMNAAFSGKQSICSDAVAHVVISGEPNITVGCSGSRKYSKVKDSEMIYGIPGKNILNLMDGLKIFAKN